MSKKESGPLKEARPPQPWPKPTPETEKRAAPSQPGKDAPAKPAPGKQDPPKKD